ncbi:MAG: hypothetical protein Q8M33_15185, partial [Hydrogenophaga sp.]|nr:hypothetical protein [Hydrogenophaga sp.]
AALGAQNMNVSSARLEQQASGAGLARCCSVGASRCSHHLRALRAGMAQAYRPNQQIQPAI